MSRFSRTLLLVGLAVLIAGCTARQRGPAAPQEPTYVHVTNQSWSQMRIYVLSGGQRIRLGEVSGSSSTTLRIPQQAVAGGRDISFLADALAGGEAQSFNIFVRPGETVRITIPPTVR